MTVPVILNVFFAVLVVVGELGLLAHGIHADRPAAT
jgi:hypothetical protein